MSLINLCKVSWRKTAFHLPWYTIILWLTFNVSAMPSSVEQEQGERSIFGSCGDCSDSTENNSMPHVSVEELEARENSGVTYFD